MPLPLRYQWDISNSNCTYEHWLECELMKRLEIEETKILQTHNSAMVPCNCWAVDSRGGKPCVQGFGGKCGAVACCIARHQ